MNDLNSKKPIGLSAPCAEIDETCRHAKTYQWSDMRPCHLIIPLDSGYAEPLWWNIWLPFTKSMACLILPVA